jgi:hypothetical protein
MRSPGGSVRSAIASRKRAYTCSMSTGELVSGESGAMGASDSMGDDMDGDMGGGGCPGVCRDRDIWNSEFYA